MQNSIISYSGVPRNHIPSQNAREIVFSHILGSVYVHRCAICWPIQAVWVNGHLYPAVNNGFVPVDQPYPHANGCQASGSF